MKKPVYVALAPGIAPRLITALMLLVLAGGLAAADAQTLTNLHLFGGPPNDGSEPSGRLVQSSDGNFYGTAFFGGVSGSGTVFRISPTGSYSNLYSFGFTDGSGPVELVQGRDGNFYGATEFGGTTSNSWYGCGTIFRISSSGSYTTLYSFAGSPNDGCGPGFELVKGNDGSFYGTTYTGGQCTNCFGGEGGTIFRINPDGSYTNLYFFGGSPVRKPPLERARAGK